MMLQSATGRSIIVEARSWIGTPHRHASAVKGLGCDCLGLILGVRAAVLGRELPASVRPYAPDWAEATGREWLLEGFEQAFRRIDPSQAEAGDMALFRWRIERPASHAAFLTGEEAIIHSHARVAVAEVSLTRPWQRRAVAFFRFPEIS